MTVRMLLKEIESGEFESVGSGGIGAPEM